MKIHGNKISPVGGVNAAGRVSKSDKNENGLVQDKISVSDNAQVFSKLLQKLKELPDIREDRVNAVSEQIANGKFSLDAESIASAFLSPRETEGKQGD